MCQTRCRGAEHEAVAATPALSTILFSKQQPWSWSDGGAWHEWCRACRFSKMLGARLEDARLASSALLERQHMLDRVLKALRAMGLQADGRFPKGFAGTGQNLQRVCTSRADSVQVHVAILAKLIV